MKEIIKYLCQYSYRLENIDSFKVDRDGKGYIVMNEVYSLEFDNLEEFKEKMDFVLTNQNK